jgi:hypothetical protein
MSEVREHVHVEICETAQGIVWKTRRSEASDRRLGNGLDG